MRPRYDKNQLPDFEQLKQQFSSVYQLINESRISAAATLGLGGTAEAIAKMCFGNQIGFAFESDFTDYFEQCYGAILVAAPTELELPDAVLIGKTSATPSIDFGAEKVSLNDLLEIWQATLEPVYPTKAKIPEGKPQVYSFETRSVLKPATSIAKPRVLIPLFPGTNCEYDSARQFERFGAITDTCVIGNLNSAMIEDSVKRLVKSIDNSQIIMFPGGFSGGDEPDGSGKFIATFFRNPAISEAVTKLIEQRDGLIIGICNGFQALIKLGLLPYGKICEMTEQSPTLTFNNIGRHQSMLVQTRIASVKSPWLTYNQVGDLHQIAISHGEGKFVADQKP